MLFTFSTMAVPNISVYDIQSATDQTFRMVRFSIPGGVTSPDEFVSALSTVEGKIPGNVPVLINGRGPIWGYGMLIHAAHPTPAVATYDPRMLGYVIVETHDESFKLGDMVPAIEDQDKASPN